MFHLPCTCHCRCLSSRLLHLSSHPMGDISRQPHQRGPERVGRRRGMGTGRGWAVGVSPNAWDRGHAPVRAGTRRAGMWSCGARDGRHRSPTRSVTRRPGRSSFVLERGGAAAHRSPWGKWWVGEWGRCETYACSSILSRQAARAARVYVDVNVEDGRARHEAWAGPGARTFGMQGWAG